MVGVSSRERKHCYAKVSDRWDRCQKLHLHKVTARANARSTQNRFTVLELRKQLVDVKRRRLAKVVAMRN
jgi:hypothetical protein